MISPGGKPSSDSLYVRPVVEEFKAFVQHKIEVLEKFRNVDEIKVYLDALELGVQSILDVQAEDISDLPHAAEVEFKGDGLAATVKAALQTETAEKEVLVEEEDIAVDDAEAGPGIETEELETQEGGRAAHGPEQAPSRGEQEVLVGEDRPPEPAPTPAEGARADAAESGDAPAPATEETRAAEKAGDGPEVTP